MEKFALITGASGGIGMDIARELAARGNNLILVARNTDKLNELEAEIRAKYKVQVKVLTKDLSHSFAAKELYESAKQYGYPIDILVNNAGFGDYGPIHKANLEKMNQMLQLNIVNLTLLTSLFAKDMAERQYGRILNIASTASFQPLPYMAAYAASKSYVRSFSEAISTELKEFGVTVTTLCPGPTETGFFNRAEMHGSKLFERMTVAKSKDVARLGVSAMMKGKRTVVHGFMNKAMAYSVSLLPTSWVLAMGKMIMK